MRLGGGKNKKKLFNYKSSKAAKKVQAEDVDPDKPIYYFGYGALVNPIARQRRGVSTDEAHAALLPNYRLTFSIGGAANIVAKTGWEVYGIVMKCSSVEDWNILKDFDAGYDCVEVDVFPLKAKDSDAGSGGDGDSIAEEEEGFAQVHDTPIRARIFVLSQDKLDQADSVKIPQERYLKVIASGMKAYRVDPDYIQDEILGVEFIPSRKPADYLVFPPDTTPTPTVSLAHWNKDCPKRLQKAARRNSKSNTMLILFRLGQHVIQVKDASPDNPFCVYLRDRLQGPQDSTWVIVQTLFDPDLPLIAAPEEVTPVHQKWAENQMMEKFVQAGVQATTILNIDLTETPASPQRNRIHSAIASMQSSVTSRRTDHSENQSFLSSEGEPSSPPPPKAKPGAWKRVKSLGSRLPSIRRSSVGTRSRSSNNSQSSLRKSNTSKLSQSQTSAEEISPLSNIHTKLIDTVPELSSDHFCAASGDEGLPLCSHRDHDHDHDPSERSEVDDTPPISTLTFDVNNTAPTPVEDAFDEQ